MKVWRIKFDGYSPTLLLGGCGTEREAREQCARLTSRDVVTCEALDILAFVNMPSVFAEPDEDELETERQLPIFNPETD